MANFKIGKKVMGRRVATFQLVPASKSSVGMLQLRLPVASLAGNQS